MQNSNPNAFIKYTGMAIQMLAIIGGGTWLGITLDAKTGNENSVWTVVLSLISVLLAIIYALKDFLKS